MQSEIQLVLGWSHPRDSCLRCNLHLRWLYSWSFWHQRRWRWRWSLKRWMNQISLSPRVKNRFYANPGQTTPITTFEMKRQKYETSSVQKSATNKIRNQLSPHGGVWSRAQGDNPREPAIGLYQIYHRHSSSWLAQKDHPPTHLTPPKEQTQYKKARNRWSWDVSITVPPHWSLISVFRAWR